jgi:RimJ/RimL family protein N-acetyltransferase
MAGGYLDEVGPNGEALVTERLTIRPVEEFDVAKVATLWQDPAVRKFLGGPIGCDAAEARARELVARPGAFVVRLQDETESIGVCSVAPGHGEQAELSYMFDAGVWGQGLATEASARLVQYGFETLLADRVVAVTQVANLASIRLLRRIGLHPVREFTEFCERQVLFAVEASNGT